jgi:hypothetical protein
MKRLGLHVEDTTPAGGALLDLSVRHPGTGRQFYVDIKNDARGKLTPLAQKMFNEHPEACRDIRSWEDVLALWEELRR